MTANYSKDIIRQLEEQTKKSDKLEKENKKLRSEVTFLRKQLSDFEENINKRINDAIEKAIVPLKEEISVKHDELSKANKEISLLKAIINVTGQWGKNYRV
jgi:predicted RNase H-like nuclease (RuvC/YqgF family)